MSTGFSDGDVGPEPDSDRGSIFSSQSFSALSDDSDEQQNCPGTSSHAFQRLKGLLQQRDHQLGLHTDQRPVEVENLAVSSEKALLQVKPEDLASRLKCLAHQLLSFSLGHNFKSSSQRTGASVARWSLPRIVLLATLSQRDPVMVWRLQHAAMQFLTSMTQSFQQRVKQTSLLHKLNQQNYFIIRLSRLQPGHSSGSRNNSTCCCCSKL